VNATILVVEDDECMRELLCLHLSGAGYEVLSAEDAIVAGHFLLEQRVDLLVADIEMPFMDGLDLVKAIRNDPAASSMPVVFVTRHAGHGERAKELGAVAYLTKPVRVSELLATVARHLKSGRELVAQ
jgi:two-component system, chemotaxis family, chemotaxis protein CheY